MIALRGGIWTPRHSERRRGGKESLLENTFEEYTAPIAIESCMKREPCLQGTYRWVKDLWCAESERGGQFLGIVLEVIFFRRRVLDLAERKNGREGDLGIVVPHHVG